MEDRGKIRIISIGSGEHVRNKGSFHPIQKSYFCSFFRYKERKSTQKVIRVRMMKRNKDKITAKRISCTITRYVPTQLIWAWIMLNDDENIVSKKKPFCV